MSETTRRIFGLIAIAAIIGVFAANNKDASSSSSAPAPAPVKPLAGEEVSEKYRDFVFDKQNGSTKCEPAVANAAKYDLRWTDTSWGSRKFSHWNKFARDDGYIKFSGDRAEAQNGIGNWVRVHYTCLFDPDTGTVVNISMDRGKMPGT